MRVTQIKYFIHIKSTFSFLCVGYKSSTPVGSS